MPIALRGAAVVPAGNPTTGFTVVIPSAVLADDICIIAVTSRDSTSGSSDVTCTDNDSGGNTWAVLGNTSDKKAWIFWKRATSGTASKTVTIANCVGSASGVLKCFSGADTSATPFGGGTGESNASGDESHASFTPDVADSMIGATVYNYGNDNAVTNLSFATAGATTMTEKLSTGGSDCACAFGHVLQTGGPTATGTLTWTQTDGLTKSITFALKPAAGQQFSQELPEALTAVDAAPKVTTHPVSETLALVDTRLSETTRTFAEVVVLVDALSRTTTRPLDEAIPLGDTIQVGRIKDLLESVALEDSLARSLQRSLSEEVVLVDARAATTTRALVEEVVLADSRAAQLTRSLVEAASLVDTLVAFRVVIKELVETVPLADGADRSATKVLSDQLPLADARSASLSRVLVDAVALVDAAAKQASRQLTESAALADQVARVAEKALVEALPLADSVTRQLVIVRELVEQLPVEDAVRKELVRAVNEQLGVIDSVTAAIVEGRPSNPTLIFSVRPMSRVLAQAQRAVYAQPQHSRTFAKGA